MAYDTETLAGLIADMVAKLDIVLAGGASGIAKVAAQLENVAAYGVLLDGSGAQTPALASRVAAARADGRTILAGKGTFLLDQHLDLSSVSMDFGAVQFRAAPALRGRLTAGVAAIEIGGVPPAAGGVYGNSWATQKSIWYYGDAPANGYVIGSEPDASRAFPAISLTDDQGPMNRYVVAISGHNGEGLQLRGDSEKKIITLLGYQVSDTLLHLMKKPGDEAGLYSPDEINVTINAASLRTVYASDPGFQCSTTVMFNVEQVRPAPGRAGVEVYGGKVETFAGELRGCYGTLIRLCRAGASSSSGGADVVLRNQVAIQVYDGPVLDMVNPKNIQGALYVRIAEPNGTAARAAIAANPGWSDTEKALAYAAGGGAAVYLQSCHRTYNLLIQLERCKAEVGVQIGRMDGPDGAIKRMVGHRIPLAIYMGDDTTSPWLYTALRINGAADCIIDATAALKGHVQVDADVERTVLRVKGDWIREGGMITVHPFADIELHVETPLASYEIFDWPHRFAGLVVRSVSDMGGGYRYDGAKWVSLSGPLTVSDIVMTSRNSQINTLFKGAGAAVHNADRALVYFAAGGAAEDGWRAGSATLTPALTAHVQAYAARVTAAGGAALPVAWRDGIDRLYIDLIDRGLWVPGDIDLSPVKALWVLCAPDEVAARLNLLFDMHNASAVGGPTHTPYVGYAGDAAGAYLDLDWAVADTPHGTALDNIHLGAMAGAAGALSQASTPDIGGNTTTWQVRAHRFDGGNQIRMGTLSGLAVPKTAMPRHVIGVRSGGRQTGYGGGMTPVQDDQVPDAMPTALYGLRAQDSYSADPVRILHAGSALTAGQTSDMIAIVARISRIADGLA